MLMGCLWVAQAVDDLSSVPLDLKSLEYSGRSNASIYASLYLSESFLGPRRISALNRSNVYRKMDASLLPEAYSQ